jgi:hypothetical protein
MQWNSVKEKLPNIGEWVLAYTPSYFEEKNVIAVVKFEYLDHRKENYWSIFSSGCGCCDSGLSNVTHWMPLPKPPED